MTTRSLPKEEVKELKEAFAWIDHDRNKIISTEDIEQAFKSLGQRPTAQEISEMMRLFGSETDPSANSGISLPIYLQKMSSLMSAMDSSEELTEAFASFDESNNGHIQLDTLQEAVFSHDTADNHLTDQEKQAISSVFKKFVKRNAGNESFVYTKFIDSLEA